MKRPKIQRTQANRSAASLLGVAAGTTRGDGGATGDGGAALGDVVARAVDLGYRVVEDYIRQGQKAAERLGTSSYGRDAVMDDLQEGGMRVARYASEFMAVWLDFMERSMGRGAAPSFETPASTRNSSPDAGTTARRPSPTTKPADGTHVRVEITSPRPTEVELDLRAEAAGRAVVLQSLRAVEPEKPRLEQVSFHAGSSEEPPTLRIRVPADQPAGVYSGLLVDEETATAAGTVSVRILRES